MAIIDLDRLVRNITAARKRIGEKRLICMPVKADAYGHGAKVVAKAALEAGVNALGVAAVEEGMELRDQGIDAPILLFSLPQNEELLLAVQYALTLFIADKEFAQAAAAAAEKAGKKLDVHLKIDTGMSRVGCFPEDAHCLAAFIASQPSLELRGCATHLAAGDSVKSADREFTALQLTRFKEAVEKIRSRGIDPGILHAANSGALILHPDSYFDMVRPGLLLYGYQPEDCASAESAIPVEPLMELVTSVSAVKRIRRGETVSYGRTWTAQEDTRVAVLPIGYADGLTRALSGRHSVLIRGKLYPIAGRICMDQTMIDLGDDGNINRGDPVTIFGGPGAPSAEDIAKTLGTIPYEVCCGVSKRVKRVYRSAADTLAPQGKVP